MKTLKISQVLLPLAIVAFAGGCFSSSPVSRIDANRDRYETWPIEVKEAVLAGEARKGMTKEQVEVAMGKPSQVIYRGASDADEVWVYRKGSGLGGVGSGLLNNSGLTVGTGVGMGPVGVGVSTTTPLGGRQRAVDEEEEVVFVNGVVTRGTSGN